MPSISTAEPERLPARSLQSEIELGFWPYECSAISWGPDAAWIRVAGELDIASSEQFGRSLAAVQADTRLVIVDLRHVTFLDSAGVHALLDADLRAREAGGRVLLVPGSAQVMRVLALTGVSARMEVLDLDPTDQRLPV